MSSLVAEEEQQQQVNTIRITSIDESELATGTTSPPTDHNAPPVDLEPTTSPSKIEPLFNHSPSPSTSKVQNFNRSIESSSPEGSSASPPDDNTKAGSSKDSSPAASSDRTEKIDGAEGKSGKAEGGAAAAEEEKKDDSMFECNICLDTAKDAVVSMCGHLFCWSCLHQWLETRPRRQLCPVCKAQISKEKVIPLYGRGSTNQEDPRTKVPPRPAGQRTEPEPAGFQGFGLNDGGFHMSFGIGAFPLGYLSSSFNMGGRGRAERGTAHFEEEQFLSKVFMWVATIFLAWLVFVY